MSKRIYWESDDSWAIYINDELRGKYKSSMGMAEHLALMIEQSSAKVPIERIAEKFRHEVLPHIRDLLEYDPDNQFEGYVFGYIMAHDGWDWSNARDVEFLSLFSSR